MSLSLKGKSALITGGSRGIGRAIAERLAADGAAVVVNYARNEERAQEVVSGVVAKGGKALAVQPMFPGPPKYGGYSARLRKWWGRSTSS